MPFQVHMLYVGIKGYHKGRVNRILNLTLRRRKILLNIISFEENLYKKCQCNHKIYLFQIILFKMTVKVYYIYYILFSYLYLFSYNQ